MSSIRANAINERTSGAGVTIDGTLVKDGQIPNQLVWALQASAIQAVTADTTVKVTFDTVLYDVYGSVASTANNRADCPLAGKYNVSFVSSINVNNVTCQVLFYLDGVLERMGIFHTAGSTSNLYRIATNVIIDVPTAGSTIEVYVRPNASANLGGSPSTFTGYWIGA
jgi:hypothetical protein